MWKLNVMVGCSDYQHSLYIDDLQDGGLIRSLLRSSVDSDDLAAGFGEVHLLGLLDDSLDHVLNSLEGWNLEADHATNDVELSDDLERG